MDWLELVAIGCFAFTIIAVLARDPRDIKNFFSHDNESEDK
jgi:hypothetical protein